MRAMMVVLAMMVLMLMAGCGGGPAGTNETNASANATGNGANVTVPAANVTAPAANATPEEDDTPAVEVPETPVGGFEAAIAAKNADVEGLKTLNLSVRSVELEFANKTGKWFKVSDSRITTDVLGLDGKQAKIGVNAVPAADYKTIRVQFKTSGDAATADKVVQFNVAHEYIVVSRQFTVKPDAAVRFVFEMDVGKSATFTGDTTIVKPAGAIKLLDGDTSLYEATMTWEQLLPPGTLEKAVNDCKDECPDSCQSKSEDCRTKCVDDVTLGCEAGGSECRDLCDPYISPFECRNNCEDASTSTCQHDLINLCGTECNKEYSAPCVVVCEAACTG